MEVLLLFLSVIFRFFVTLVKILSGISLLGVVLLLVLTGLLVALLMVVVVIIGDALRSKSFLLGVERELVTDVFNEFFEAKSVMVVDGELIVLVFDTLVRLLMSVTDKL